MVKFTIHIHFQESLDKVLAAFLNHENMPFYSTDLEKAEVISGGPHIVGSIMHLHYRKKDRYYMMVDRLDYCEPGRKYISTVKGDIISAQVEITFDETEDGTKMSLSWAGKGRSLSTRLILPLIKRKIKSGALKELETFRNLLDTIGVDFQKNKDSKD